jgi:hypothetical protein
MALSIEVIRPNLVSVAHYVTVHRARGAASEENGQGVPEASGGGTTCS